MPEIQWFMDCFVPRNDTLYATSLRGVLNLIGDAIQKELKTSHIYFYINSSK